jgi:hypothetical protein
MRIIKEGRQRKEEKKEENPKLCGLFYNVVSI